MRLEIRCKDPKTKEDFKVVAAHFPTQEDAIKELIKIYNSPGRTVTPHLPGGIITPQHSGGKDQ